VGVFKGFRDFLMRGNVIDLAVAVVIGVAFNAIVTAFSKDFIGGLIGAIGGTRNFDDAGFPLGDGRVVLGSTINALINFLIIAAVIYFLIVLPMNALAERRKRGEEPEPETPSEDILLLQEIRDLLRAQNALAGKPTVTTTRPADEPPTA
jgi:large conductance mechanosensitive channel